MNREAAVLLALVALAAASVLVSIGSWVLFWWERRARRRDPEAGS